MWKKGISSPLLLTSIFQRINRINLSQEDKKSPKSFNNFKEVGMRTGTFSHHDKGIACMYLRYSKSNEHLLGRFVMLHISKM